MVEGRGRLGSPSEGPKTGTWGGGAALLLLEEELIWGIWICESLQCVTESCLLLHFFVHFFVTFCKTF
jgi:hypothetical protein